MKNVNKRILLAVLIVAATVGIGLVAVLTSTPADAARGSCATVRCMACPDGSHLRMHWPNCCECVPDRN